MNGHAAIAGGGIGGLLAAHALAGRFERVTLLERDCYPSRSGTSAPPARRGAPQSRCLHLLAAAGVAAFDHLMPGWRHEVVALGARPFDASGDALVRLSAGRLPRMRSGITTYACSRALLESVLRRGLSGRPAVHVREGHKVVGLLGSPRGDRVTGVRIAGPAGETTLAADLVVDASGATSTLARWVSRLQDGRASRADRTVIHSGRQYVSRWFRLAPGDAPDWSSLSVAPTIGTALRSAIMLRAEGDCWAVVLLAPAGEAPPADDRAFLDFAAGLGDDDLREALTGAEPVSPIHRYGPTSSRLVHYERLTAWPGGLVAIGDSVCALDPYCGLGMTAAAMGASLLGTFLDEEGTGDVPGLAFQKKLASLNAAPWRLATGRDPDGRPMGQDRRHLSRLHESAASSPEVAHALLAVQHLLRPAEALTEVAG
jgi:2-polyprenyl-6-methoxyphenol hydroxylase-like FAD-dependent oxidoreductase